MNGIHIDKSTITFIIRELLNQNLNKADFLNLIQDSSNIKISKENLTNLLLEIRSNSIEFLNLEDYCKLNDKFSEWNLQFRNRLKTTTLLHKMIYHEGNLGKYYPIHSVRDLETFLIILKKFENLTQITYSDIVILTSYYLIVKKTNIRNYQLIHNLFLDCEKTKFSGKDIIINGFNNIIKGDFITAIKWCKKVLNASNDFDINSLVFNLIGDCYYFLRDYNNAEINFRKVLEILDESAKIELKDQLISIIAEINILQGNLAEAIDLYEQFIKTNKDNEIIASKFNLKLGILYFKKKEFHKAIYHYNQAISFNKLTYNWSEIANTHTSLGIVYFKLKKFGLAKKSFQKGIEYGKKVFNSIQLADLYLLIGNKILKHKGIDEALKYYNNAIKLNKKIKEWDRIAQINIKIGNFYRKKRKPMEVVKYYLDAIKYNEICENWDQIAKTYANIGKIYSDQSNFNESLNCFKKAIEFNERAMNWDQLAQTHFVIGNLLKSKNEIDKAIQHYKKSIEFNEKIENWFHVAKTYDTMAVLSKSQGDLEKTIIFYLKAIEYNEKKEDMSKLPQIYHSIGRLCEKKGNYNEAIEQYIKSIEFHEITQNWRSISIICNLIANCHMKQGQFDKAIGYFEKAIDYDKKFNNWKGIAAGCMGIGSHYMERGDFENALKYYILTIQFNIKNAGEGILNKANIEEAHQHFLEINYAEALNYYILAIDNDIKVKNWKNFAQVYIRIGDLFVKNEDFKIAKLLYEKARKLDKINENLFGYALSTIKIGNLLLKQGNYDEAIQYYHEAIAIDKKNEKWENIVKTYMQIGEVFSRKGQNKKALEFFNKAKQIDIKNNNWMGLARSNSAIGTLYQKIGDYNEAIRYLDESIKYAIKTSDLKSIAQIYMKIVNCYDKKGVLNKTIEYLKKANKINLQINDLSSYLLTNIRLGNLYYYMENYNKAILQYEKTLEINLKLNNFTNISKSYIAIGRCYLHKENFEKAFENFEKANNYNEKESNWVNIAKTYRVIGNILIEKGEYKKAIENLEKSIEYDKKIEIWEEIAKTHIVISNALLKMGDYKTSIAEIQKAISLNIQNENLSKTILYYIKIGNLYKEIDKYDDTIKYYDKALNVAKRLKNVERIINIKIKKSRFFRNIKNWKESYETYNEVSVQLKEMGVIRDSVYYELQALKCLAKFQENAGLIANVSELYLRIAHKYEQIDNFWLKTYYNLIHEIFELELKSQAGLHNECLDSIIQLKKTLDLFLEDRKKISRGYFINLIEFRIKQIEFFYNREKAFILEDAGNFNECIDCLKKCVSISKNLVSPRYKLDYRLYEGISIYYSAQVKRLEYRNFSLIMKENIKSKIKFIENNVLPLFCKAKDIFHELNQHLRERFVNYELNLIEGKISELKEDYVNAFSKYNEALALLKETDEKRANQFTSSLSLMRSSRKGFPIEKYLLYKPPIGSSFIEYCSLPDMELKQNFFHISYENLPFSLNLEENYILNLNLKVDEAYFDYFDEEVYYLKFIETSQKIQLALERDLLNFRLKFKIPIVNVKSKKIFQFELSDSIGNLIKTKEVSIKFDSFKSEISKINFEKKELSLYVNEEIKQIQKLLENKKLSELYSKLDGLIDQELSFEVKYFLQCFREALVGFRNLLDFDYIKARSSYLKAITRINNNIELFSGFKREFLEIINNQYLTKFRDNLQTLITNSKNNPKLKKIDSLTLEIYEGKVQSFYKNDDFTLTLQLTIAFFERFMDKILFEKFQIDYDKIIWESLDSDLINRYKDIFREETRLSQDQEIILKEKLEFESARCLLIVLDEDFRNFCHKESKKFSSIRQARNQSYLEHGVTPVEKKIANQCLELTRDLKNHINSFNRPENMFDKNLELFIKFIKFIYQILSYGDISEDLLQVPEKIEDYGDDIDNV